MFPKIGALLGLPRSPDKIVAPLPPTPVPLAIARVKAIISDSRAYIGKMWIWKGGSRIEGFGSCDQHGQQPTR